MCILHGDQTERGAALTELAFVLPLLLGLFIAAFEFSRALKFMEGAATLSREVAVYAQRTCNTLDFASAFDDLEALVVTPGDPMDRLNTCLDNVVAKANSIKANILPSGGTVDVSITLYSLTIPSAPPVPNPDTETNSTTWRISSKNRNSASSATFPRYGFEKRPAVCGGACAWPWTATCPVVSGGSEITVTHNFGDQTQPKYKTELQEDLACLLVAQRVVAVGEVSVMRNSVIPEFLNIFNFASREVYDVFII